MAMNETHTFFPQKLEALIKLGQEILSAVQFTQLLWLYFLFVSLVLFFLSTLAWAAVKGTRACCL